MASLNLSTNGPSITRSYQSVVNATPANTGAAASPTYAQWAVFGVTTPLINAFQQDAGNKESVLKVQSSDGGFDGVACIRRQRTDSCINRGRIGRLDRRFLRGKDPICVCESKGPQHRTAQACPHRVVRGRRSGKNQGVLQ